MRRFYELLPGPPVARIVLMVIVIAVALVALGFIFEWAGDLLDSGGVIGDSPA